MADFCQQCSIENFGEDFGDLKDLTKPEAQAQGLCVVVLCEGCGAIQVDVDGKCISNCLKNHDKARP